MAPRPLCELPAGRCVECLAHEDCDPGEMCNMSTHTCFCPPLSVNDCAGRCGNITNQCGNNYGCTCTGPQLCDTVMGLCVDCLMGTDCPLPDMACNSGECSCPPAMCDGFCGLVENGCGAQVTCDTCESPDNCGGGGAPGICGMGTCSASNPCVRMGWQCGMASNGCGGSVDCGTCQQPAQCGRIQPHHCD